MKQPHKYFWAIVALFGLYLGVVALVASSGDPEKGFHIHDFGTLPVLDGGRIKPMDTLARTNLMLINHRQSFTDDKGNSQPATKWALDAMVSSFAQGNGPAFDYKIFRIENQEVLDLLDLKPRPGSWRYSLDEILPKFDDLRKEVDRAMRIEPKARKLFDNKVIELFQHMDLFYVISMHQAPFAIPVNGGQNWLSMYAIHQQAKQGIQPPDLAVRYVKMLGAYSQDDVDGFNQSVKEYQEAVAREVPEAMSTVRLEAYFNAFAPFYHCAILYTFVFLLACVSWLGWFPTLNRAAFWSMLLIAIVHTGALVARMYIQGRPPVTNLYSSAIFIGWGCVVTCLIAECFFRTSIAIAVGCVTGAMSLLVAHFLSLSGDTMEMMQAVLDTNFWLATHVTCITFGYTATFVAGFMGVAYILMGVFTRMLDKGGSTLLNKMMYGVICFAMFLSFTGTVLGGIWADQSWGRFWGWDPKENGALLIVIWNALILHARWGGMVKQRGIAVLAVLGNIVTAWSWFGTNLLGVGLHSYGFMEGAMTWLLVFAATQLAIAGVGLMPLRMWASFTPRPQETPPAHPTDRAAAKVAQPV